MHPFQEYVNPHLGDLLSRLKMDKQFVRGEGCYLFDQEGHRYLDAVAAYGALPFGHNPPEIWAALQDVQAAAEPNFVQPAALGAAGELARELLKLAPSPLRYVTFANSGAEAVEAAIKLCRAATGRLGILATDNSFHGKTLGALSATGRNSYQQAFGAPVPGFARVPYGDAAALEAALAGQPEHFAALILEPLQGEGGIIEPPPGYLATARALCDRYGALLIFDEVQTGLGRTGRLFACQAEGVTPDVLVLAKALGGGLMPIGACLSTEAAYSEEFALKHSSTFGGGALACRAGLAALRRLTDGGGALVRQVAEHGARLKAGLEEVARCYPHVIRAVRGRGYMLGVEFAITRDTFDQSLMGVLMEQEALTPLISSYLLNVERVRVAPTLNGNAVIRIEPPLIAGPAECDQVVAAVGGACRLLAVGSTAGLVCHLLDLPVPDPIPAAAVAAAAPGAAATGAAYAAATAAAPRVEVSDPATGRFAFLVHPVNLHNFAEFDTSLEIFNTEQLAQLTARWSDLFEPFVVAGTRITSAAGATAYGEFIGVVRTAEELLAMPSSQAVAEIRAAVDLARERGARLVGLGAYTSVVTRGGLHLKQAGMPLTTGNSYTVVAAIEAVVSAAQRLGMSLPHTTAAVVGATGAIGRAAAILLSEQVPRLYLVGNPARVKQSRRRLNRVAADICRHLVRQSRAGQSFGRGSIAGQLMAAGPWPPDDAPPADWVAAFEARSQGATAVPIYVTTNAGAVLPLADVVVTATSSVAAFVTPGMLRYGAVVCDLSRPPNVSREVQLSRPDVLVIDGGVVAVPGSPDLGFNFGFEPGLAYACMAETMMLALEQRYQHYSLGADLDLDSIMYLRELARRHGFSLADLRSFDRPLDPKQWQRVLRLRTADVAGNAD